MSGNPLHGPRRVGLWLPPMRWPTEIDGHPREVVPEGRCELCPATAPALRYLTCVTYGGQRLCLAHTLDLAEKGARPTS